MAKRYRNQNGLILPDDSLSLPKPEIPAPWWAGRLSPARGMSRRRCCCVRLCDCTYCDEYFGVWEYLLSVNGLTSGGCSSEICSFLNTDWIVSCTSSVGICRWVCDFDSPIVCSGSTYTAFGIQLDSLSAYVGILRDDDAFMVLFYAPDRDCLNWSSTPFTPSGSSPPWPVCDLSYATCAVTAL